MSAELASSVAVLSTASLGMPVSMTQSVAGGLAGTGASEGGRRVRWQFTVPLMTAWLVTLPAGFCAGLARRPAPQGRRPHGAVTVRRVLADLTGRSHRRTIDILLPRSSTRRSSGVEVAVRLADGALVPGAARAAMADVEHEGDAQRAALVAELSASLTTPIDREDLYRFSRSVDDVLDNLRDLVRETDLFGSPATPPTSRP